MLIVVVACTNTLQDASWSANLTGSIADQNHDVWPSI